MTQSHGDTSRDTPTSGLVFEIENSSGTKVEKLWAFNAPSVYTNAFHKPVNSFVQAEFTSIKNAAGTYTLTAIKTFAQDKNGNTTSVKEYGFVDYGDVPRTNGFPTGLPSGIGNPIRATYSEFYNATPDSTDTTTNSPYAYWNFTNIKNAVASTEVQNVSNQTVSRTEIEYDNYSTTANPVLAKTWDSTKGVVSAPLVAGQNGNAVSTATQYDPRGNPILATDAKGNQTQITYGSINGFTGLYPTQTISAYQTPIARTSTAVYDFSTGLVTTATDVDNNVSVVTVYDPLGRPTKVRNAADSPLESWTQTEYNDVARRVIVRTDLETINDGKKVAIQHYDQLGRVRLSRSIENIATEDRYNETHGIKVETRYQTGNPNSYQITSNPFRAAYATQAASEQSMGWTRSKSWNTGRKQQVENFSGAALPAPWGSNANSTGIVTTDIDADRTLVTDQAGKKRMSRTNALGQLKDVWEITASDANTEAITFGNPAVNLHGYKTSYSYDTLNNLTTVNQGVQTRSFSYSSLSRLLSAANPESGLIQYVYDNNGNLTKKTDARNVQTDYVYDALNRVTNRNYATPGGTPPNYQATANVTYIYDNLANAKGKLTKVSSSISTTEYTEFDILGRVTASKQTTEGGASGGYTTGYTYNLSGALIEETYPSGRVVKNVLDSNGDLETVKSKKNSSAGLFDYAKNFTYNGAGAVTSMQLGNGRWESTVFNSRLQPTQIALGTTGSGSLAYDLLKLNYGYGTSANNGNVLTQDITVKRPSQSDLVFNQTFTYDSLNRITSAEEKTGETTNWKQTFSFDRYGNRNFVTSGGATTTLPESFNPDIYNPTVNASNNKFNTGQDWLYDAAGNVIGDPEGRSFAYDAENKQIEVENSNSVVVGTYFFDGDGKRVKKVVPSTGEVTIFVYDAGGKLIGEYSTVVQPAQDAKVQYLTNDNLGTPRINTNANGSVTSRSDYMPYGEELTTQGGRASSERYIADDVRQGFTGYENDGETGLDYAQSRIYAGATGRFTSVDTGTLTPADPQNWNRYVMVQNNPIKFVDPTGKDLILTGRDADYIVGELSGATGLKLQRCAKVDTDAGCKKVGQVLVVGIVEKQSTKKYESLRDKLVEIVGDTKTSITINTGRNQPGTFFDGFDKRELDVADYDAAKKDAPEFALRSLGHVLEEYYQAETAFAQQEENDKYNKSHVKAMEFESRVISDFTGNAEETRQHPRGTHIRSNPVTYVFTSVEYDVRRKTGSLNTIEKVTKRNKP